MKIISATIGIFAIFIVAFSNLANAGGYAGMTGGVIAADGPDFKVAQLVVGIQANDWIGGELRYGQGLGSESYQGVSVELDDYYGVYATLTLPLGDSVNPYLIAGRTWATLEASYMGYSASATESSDSFGAGIRFSARDSFIIGVEYMQIMDDANSLTLSAIFPF